MPSPAFRCSHLVFLLYCPPVSLLIDHPVDFCVKPMQGSGTGFASETARRNIVRKLIPTVLFALALGVGTVQAADIVVKLAPPKVLVEKRGSAPSRDHVWIAGYH